MKIILLTSDIIDGLIVMHRLLSDGKNVKAVIYEKKTLTVKGLGKRILYLLAGKTGAVSFGWYKRKGIKVLSVDNINSDEVYGVAREIHPGAIVTAGTRKLDERIYGMAQKGAINLHSGILPYYRGADSELWALVNNDIDKIGVSVHYLTAELDAGDVIVTGKQKVLLSDTHSSLRMKNLLLGARKVSKALTLIDKGIAGAVRQDKDKALTYRSAGEKEKALYRNMRAVFALPRKAVYKDFGPEGMRVSECVAERTMAEQGIRTTAWKPDFFCLRIDADEYESANFQSYYHLFERYKDAVSIFFNVYSFKDAAHEIKKCARIGLDIGSHGYYHHTYNDYESNRYNIERAREFFDTLGVRAKGFVAPTGKWNQSVSLALEDAGYDYSSEFAYDYTGFPSYPVVKGRYSSVLQIPVFPVAPELFLEKGYKDIKAITGYYMKAVDRMRESGVPVIIYAHTNPKFPEVPVILAGIMDYAIGKLGLRQGTMSGFFYSWTKDTARYSGRPQARQYGHDPAFDGALSQRSFNARVKRRVKVLLDYEDITPDNELKGTHPAKAIKLLARRAKR
jgi:folate-dependent phosphoribosylglycinamide formyltransferase PurN